MVAVEVELRHLRKRVEDIGAEARQEVTTQIELGNSRRHAIAVHENAPLLSPAALAQRLVRARAGRRRGQRDAGGPLLATTGSCAWITAPRIAVVETVAATIHGCSRSHWAIIGISVWALA